MKKSLSACALLTIAACSLHAQTAGPFDFETPGQLSGNFRTTFQTTFPSQISTGGQGFVEVSANSNNPWVAVYDTTPLDTSDAAQTFSGPITITIDVSGATDSSSFGFFLFDPTNSSNNLLTVFNLDTTAGGAGNEQFRFWKDGSLTSNSTGTSYGPSSFTGTNGLVDVGSNSWVTNAAAKGAAAVDPSSPYTFYTLTCTYDPIASTLSFASAAFSATLNIPAADLISNPAIALRVNDPSTTAADTTDARFDNFAVVPEPMTASLFGLAGVALAFRRSRRRA